MGEPRARSAATDEAQLDEGWGDEPSRERRSQPDMAEVLGEALASDVETVRELYAQGDAESALRLANDVSDVFDIRAKDRDRPALRGERVDLDLKTLIPAPGPPELDLDLDLAFPKAPPTPARDLESEVRPVAMRDRAEESSPDSLVRVDASQLTLTQRQSIPRVVKTTTEIASLPIDHRAGFLLVQMDGMHTLEEILDVCAMPAAEALELIAMLRVMGVIAID